MAPARRRELLDVKFGIALGRLNPAFFDEVAMAADELGYESVWMPEHLVFPVEMTRSPYPGEEHPPVPPETPVYDVFAYLSFLAGRTSRVRLATHVYNLALRHPFVAARAVQTLDIVSGGRAEIGIGAGWLESEWVAAGLDFASRGRRLDEAVAVCKRLWDEEVVEHHGEFFDFDRVMFEPKPVQRPWPPLLVGGESIAALRRAARLGDGWVGMGHTLDSIGAPVARLRRLREEYDRADRPFAVVVGGPVERGEDVERWEDAGVDRLIVSPWRRSREAVDGMRRFAELVGLVPA
jgi:probable F420-dependent oxidoreductase